MALRGTLHGRNGNDSETEYAQKLLEVSGIPYRLELDREQNEEVELVYFGRYTGLSQIHQAFGSGSLEELTAVA